MSFAPMSLLLVHLAAAALLRTELVHSSALIPSLRMKSIPVGPPRRLPPLLSRMRSIPVGPPRRSPPHLSTETEAGDQTRIVRVRNVHFDAGPADVSQLASAFGDVEHVWLAPYSRGTKHRGHGRITFRNADAAARALAAGTVDFWGRELVLEEEEQQLPEPPKKVKRRRAVVKRAVVTGRDRDEVLAALEQSRFRDYASAGAYRRAVEAALAKLGPLRSIEEYTVAVGAAARSRDPLGAVRLLRAAQQQLADTAVPKVLPGLRAYNNAISACIGPARWKSAIEVLRMMPERLRTATTYSLVVRACAKAGRLDEAMRFLRAINVQSAPQPDEARRSALTAWNAVLDAAAKLGRWREASKLVVELRGQGIEPNLRSYLAAITACATVPDLANARVGSWRRGDPSSEADERAAAARSLLRDSLQQLPPDLRCFNAAIRACALQRDPTYGISLLAELRQRGLAPDAFSYGSAIAGCSGDEEAGWARALELLEEMRSVGVRPDRFVYSAALAACAAGRRGVEAQALLAAMERDGVEPDAYCYTACISALGRGDRVDEALDLLATAEKAASSHSTETYNAAISACERAGRWQEALQLLERMRLRGLANTVSLNAAISACEKAGQWRQAMELLESASVRDAASYTSAITALAAEGRASTEARELGDRAMELLRRAEAAGIRQDTETFNAALSALEKAGQWQAALELFEEMKGVKGVKPNVVTYNVLMQTLAGAGRLVEGFELLEQFEAAGFADDTKSYSLHRALLEACRANGTRAQVERVNEAMTRRGLSAVAPVARASWEGTERRYTNRDMFAGANTLSAVGNMARRMWTRAARSRSYKPSFQALPYAFTQSATRLQKVRSLQGHAEKLMLADLLERSRGQTKGIELSINFKMCADCHRYFKAVSALEGRNITVREPKLTHVFRNGECSCGDTWRWEERRGRQ